MNSTFSETALESAWDIAQIPHPSGASGLPPDGLHTPVDYFQIPNNNQNQQCKGKDFAIKSSSKSKIHVLGISNKEQTIRTNDRPDSNEKRREGFHTLPLAGSREGTSRAATLLEMEAATATPHTQSVGLVPPLTEASCSLTLFISCTENRVSESIMPIYKAEVRERTERSREKE